MAETTSTPSSPSYESVYGYKKQERRAEQITSALEKGESLYGEPIKTKPEKAPAQAVAPAQDKPQPKPPSSSYVSQAGTSRLDQPPEKSTFQKIKEKAISAGKSAKATYETMRQSKAGKALVATKKSAAAGVQKHIIQPARGFGKEVLIEAKTGFVEGKKETKESIKATVRAGAKAVTRAPVTIGGKVKERIELGRKAMRERRGIEWGGGIIPRQEGTSGVRGGFPKAPPVSLFGTALGYEPLQRQRGTGRFVGMGGAGSGLRIQLRYGGGISSGGRMPSGVGRAQRFKIDRGIIKPYWSKKLKKLARTNIRRFGEEEGLTRTRQIAELAGWKMQ